MPIRLGFPGRGRGSLGGGGRSFLNPRLILGLLVAAGSLIAYWSNREFNPVTQEMQHIGISHEQEVALGLQAAPEMAAQFGGLHSDPKATAMVKQVGERVVSQSDARESPYEWDFHLLADAETINAFALPGGQIFITAGLLGRLETEGQLAGVLGHEVGHVVGRHGAEHMAKQQLTQGLTGAAVLATYDPQDPSTQNTAAVAQMVAGLVTMKYGRDDELESDRLGVRFVAEAGYDPNAMIGVMRILAEAGGERSQPEFFSTHPNPENRVAQIETAIAEQFPNGLPGGLTP